MAQAILPRNAMCCGHCVYRNNRCAGSSCASRSRDSVPTFGSCHTIFPATENVIWAIAVMIVHIISSCLHKCKLDKHFFHVGVVVACVVCSLLWCNHFMEFFHGNATIGTYLLLDAQLSWVYLNDRLKVRTSVPGHLKASNTRMMMKNLRKLLYLIWFDFKRDRSVVSAKTYLIYFELTSNHEFSINNALFCWNEFLSSLYKKNKSALNELWKFWSFYDR